MKKALLIIIILSLVVITTGSIFMKFADTDKTGRPENIQAADRSLSPDSKDRTGADAFPLTVFPVTQIRKTSDYDSEEGLHISCSDSHENGLMDLNDVAVYNGIISEISVSPTVVMYDYNHDGIVDVRKTVLFFNIG